MMSQMHLVQNAARLAMADHRAAAPRHGGRAGAVSFLRALAARLVSLLAGRRA